MDELKQSLSEEQRFAARRALMRAVAIAGTQVGLALKIGVTQQAVSKWLKTDGLIPGRHAEAVEKLTGVSRHELRPDVFPVQVLHAPPAWIGVDHGTARVSFQNGAVLQRDNNVGAAA